MPEEDILPHDIDHRSVADKLAPLTRPARADAVAILLSAVPTIGGPISTFLSQRQQQLAFERLSEVLEEVEHRVASLESAGVNTSIDEDFAELVTNVAPLIARTPNASKRSRFAALLSNAARGQTEEDREEARTMALLLDSLEYPHVALLDRLMELPATQSYDGLWGAYRRISVDRRFFKRSDGDLLLRLEAVGLIDLSDFRRKEVGTELVVSSLGISFWTWLTSADQ